MRIVHTRNPIKPPLGCKVVVTMRALLVSLLQVEEMVPVCALEPGFVRFEACCCCLAAAWLLPGCCLLLLVCCCFLSAAAAACLLLLLGCLAAGAACLWLLLGCFKRFKRVETCHGGAVADVLRYLVRHPVRYLIQATPSFPALQCLQT